jgi:formate dehydrogenase major subunit
VYLDFRYMLAQQRAGEHNGMQTTAIMNGECSRTAPAESSVKVGVVIDGSSHVALPGERLLDLINRVCPKLSRVCYHPQLGPIQTCDTCLVEINGQLVRACATTVSNGMRLTTESSKAHAARQEAFDRILTNHMLYCTVCDNNNGNCTVHD